MKTHHFIALCLLLHYSVEFVAIGQYSQITEKQQYTPDQIKQKVSTNTVRKSKHGPLRMLSNILGGIRLQFGIESIEVAPFVVSTVSCRESCSKWSYDAGIRFELYSGYGKYGVNMFDRGGNFSVYMGFGWLYNHIPEKSMTNNFDVRTFAGNGVSLSNVVLGYGLTQFFGQYVAEGRKEMDNCFYSRTGIIFNSLHVDNSSLVFRYGNDNLLFGNKLDANESAYASLQYIFKKRSYEIGFFNVTDQITRGSRQELKTSYRRISDRKGTRLVEGRVWDKRRKLATYKTKGPGIKHHVLYIALSEGSCQMRVGIQGETAFNLTQGFMHKLYGLHLFPTDRTTPFFDVNIVNGRERRHINQPN